MSEMSHLLKQAIEKIYEGRRTCKDTDIVLAAHCELCGPLSEAIKILLQAGKLDDQMQK